MFFTRLTVVEGSSVVVDSGDVYDSTLNGGRLGVFVSNQPGLIWSNLVAQCRDRVNYALNFDGMDDYVQLPSVTELQLDNRLIIIYYYGFHELHVSYNSQ